MATTTRQDNVRTFRFTAEQLRLLEQTLDYALATPHSGDTTLDLTAEQRRRVAGMSARFQGARELLEGTSDA